MHPLLPLLIVFAIHPALHHALPLPLPSLPLLPVDAGDYHYNFDEEFDQIQKSLLWPPQLSTPPQCPTDESDSTAHRHETETQSSSQSGLEVVDSQTQPSTSSTNPLPPLPQSSRETDIEMETETRPSSQAGFTTTRPPSRPSSSSSSSTITTTTNPLPLPQSSQETEAEKETDIRSSSQSGFTTTGLGPPSTSSTSTNPPPQSSSHETGNRSISQPSISSSSNPPLPHGVPPTGAHAQSAECGPSVASSSSSLAGASASASGGSHYRPSADYEKTFGRPDSSKWLTRFKVTPQKPKYCGGCELFGLEACPDREGSCPNKGLSYLTTTKVERRARLSQLKKAYERRRRKRMKEETQGRQSASDESMEK